MTTPAYASGTTPPPSLRFCIREARQDRGWTQAQLATAAGLERSNVALLEIGRREPTVTTLVRLARALGTTLDALVDVAGDKRGKTLMWRCGDLRRTTGERER
jgi:transcriptional regulator with XRE-family HTH domain